MYLDENGAFEVRVENVGSRAIATARDFRPDLIFLDIVMPDADGGAVAAEINADPVLHTDRLSDRTRLPRRDGRRARSDRRTPVSGQAGRSRRRHRLHRKTRQTLKPAREAGGLLTPDRLTDEPLDRRQLCALLGRGQRDRITALSGFGRRCIPSGGVARRSNAAGLSPRAATGRYPIFPPTAVATFCPSSAAETIPPA